MEQTSITRKYVRKPLYVEAVQVTNENFHTVARWCFGEICNVDQSPVTDQTPLNPSTQFIQVRVHKPRNERQSQAYVGDWILYTDKGYKVYNDVAFDANFEPVPVDHHEQAAA